METFTLNLGRCWIIRAVGGRDMLPNIETLIPLTERRQDILDWASSVIIKLRWSMRR